MNRLPSSRMDWSDVSRHVRASLLRLSALTVLCLTAGWIPFAHANPVPMTYLGVAVREESGGFCDEWPFVECQGITDVTDLTGRLEFDFYLFSYVPDSLVWEDVRWRAYWPSDWAFVSAEVCGGFIVEQGANQVILEKPSLAGGSSTAYTRALASVVLDVHSRGRLQSRFLSGELGDSFAPDWNGSAEAGYPCGGCPDRSCYGGFPFDPSFDPESLALEIPMGSVRHETFEINADDGEDQELLFSSSVPWMTIQEVQHPYDWEYSVTVRISAQGLPTGDYQGVLLADASSCAECAPIHLTVLEPTSGTEDGTWGALKRRFVRGSR